MPWLPNDAHKHNKAADTPIEKKQWAEVANSVLKRTKNEGRAIRSANAVIARRNAGLDSVTKPKKEIS